MIARPPHEFDIARFMAALRKEVLATRSVGNFRIARGPGRPWLALLKRKRRRRGRHPPIGSAQLEVKLFDLLKYHGSDFINRAYVKLLGRRPDPLGLANHLLQLHGSWLDKVDVLHALRGSSEGGKRNVRIRGLAFAVFLKNLYRRPLVKYPRWAISTILAIPGTARTLAMEKQAFEAYRLSDVTIFQKAAKRGNAEHTGTLGVQDRYENNRDRRMIPQRTGRPIAQETNRDSQARDSNLGVAEPLRLRAIAGRSAALDTPQARRSVVADIAPLGVVLGADSLALARSGIGRVTLEMFRGLRENADIADFRLFVKGRLARTADWNSLLDGVTAVPEDVAIEPLHRTFNQRLRSRLGRFSAVRRLHQVKLQLQSQQEVRQLRGRAPGGVVYHEPNFIAHPFDGVTVVAVNDLSWHCLPDYHPIERIDWIERNLPQTLKQASRFVAISEFTAGEMVSGLGIARERIDVVTLAPSASFQPMSYAAAAAVLARYGLRDRGFVLSVSTLEPRKNLDRLLAAHQALPQALREKFPLVIAGGSGWGQVLDTEAAEQARRDGALRLLGYVPDADLVALFSRCTVCPYVSLYEGFGLPVLEAMASGAPVIASATTAVGETAGDAAWLVDPMDEAAISRAIQGVLESEELADQLRAKGLAHAAHFTWQRTMTDFIGSWRTALAGW